MEERDAEQAFLIRRKNLLEAFESNNIPLDLNTALNLLVISGEILAVLDQDVMRASKLFEKAYMSKRDVMYIQALRREPRQINQTVDEWIDWAEVNYYIKDVGRDGVVFSLCSCGNYDCKEKSVYYLVCGHGNLAHVYKILNVECPKCFVSRIIRKYFEKTADYTT